MFVPFGWGIPHRDGNGLACRHMASLSESQTQAVQRVHALVKTK